MSDWCYRCQKWVDDGPCVREADATVEQIAERERIEAGGERVDEGYEIQESDTSTDDYDYDSPYVYDAPTEEEITESAKEDFAIFLLGSANPDEHQTRYAKDNAYEVETVNRDYQERTRFNEK